MTKVMNRANQERMIRAEIIKHGWDPEEVDVYALIDPTLSYRENRKNIAYILKYKAKTRSTRQQTKEIEHGYCMHLLEQCETGYKKPACNEFVKERCHKEYGSPDVPPEWFSPKKTKKQKKAKQEPDNKCTIGSFWVNQYTRYCPPCKNGEGGRGKFLNVKGHCRTGRGGVST